MGFSRIIAAALVLVLANPSPASGSPCPRLDELEASMLALQERLPIAPLQVERFLDPGDRLAGGNDYAWLPFLIRFAVTSASPWFIVDQVITALTTPVTLGRKDVHDWPFIENPLRQMRPEEWGFTRERLCAFHGISASLREQSRLANLFVLAILAEEARDGDRYFLRLPPPSFDPYPNYIE